LQSEKYLKMAGDTSDQRQEEGILATFFNNPCGIELLKSVALRCEVAVLMGRWEDGKMGRWEDGKMGRWEVGKLERKERCKVRKEGEYLYPLSSN